MLSKRIIHIAVSLKELEDLSAKNEKILMADLGFRQGFIDVPPEAIQALKKAKPTKKTVSLHELYTPQSTVLAKEVQKLVRKDRPDKTKSHLSIFRPDAKYPQVIEYQGKLFIADGNHRLAAAALKGLLTAEVLYYKA